MEFNKDDYQIQELTAGTSKLTVRAFRDRIYVDKPISPEYQRMHIFAPEIYYHGGAIRGYTLHTAPVFMPNMVGGYAPGLPGDPAGMPWDSHDRPNTIFRALEHGYIVAAPAIRGRTLQDETGNYIGKAPACITDYKAAVRYLRHFAQDIPGDTNKIITNGTSAGGALSSLMGATGNHPDYEIFLDAIGAAKERDDVFAASCYCPITNLDHADSAYEWQFLGVNTTLRHRQVTDPQGNTTSEAYFEPMSPTQTAASTALAKAFPAYVNALAPVDEEGRPLTLNDDGTGSFLEYMKGIVAASAQKAIDEGVDLTNTAWLSILNGRISAVDWPEYAKDITRMKVAPAFDGLNLETPENDLFGDSHKNLCHFTTYSLAHSQAKGTMADSTAVKLLNPMYYIADPHATASPHWRIRHGERDRDTSLAISALLTLKLRQQRCQVDYHAPWNMPHAGDYDLEELFAWIDNICRN